MIELAKNHGEGPTFLKNTTTLEALTEHYLEQLIAPLRNAGLVRSIRGAYGGYVLALEPSKITAGDVIRVLEGPITLVEGLEDEGPAQRELWIRIRDAIKGVLDQTSLSDLASHSEDSETDGYMFYI